MADLPIRSIIRPVIRSPIADVIGQGGVDPILDPNHPDLVAMYTMDNISGATLVDETANGNDGTITGAVQIAGKIGNALDFDGVNDEVSLPHAPFVLSQGCVSAWVNMDAASTRIRVLSLSSSLSASDYVNLAVVDWWTSPGDYRIYYQVDPGGVPADFRNFYGSTSIAAGVWTHLAWQSNGSELEMFVNGVKQTLTETGAKTNNGQFLASAPTDQADIGLLRRNSPAYDNSSVDEMRIFNAVRSQAEITTLAGEA